MTGTLSRLRPIAHDAERAARRTCAIVATLTTTVCTERRELIALRGVASGLEIRADLTGELNLDEIRELLDAKLIYSLRSIAYDGAFTGSTQERHRLLRAAAQTYDVVDLELDRDLTPELLAAVPPHRRRICWYGKGLDHSGLASVFARMAATPAQLYLLAPEAGNAEQAMAPLLFLARLGRADVTAFATGELGTYSRLLAPWFGAPVVIGGLGPYGGYGVPPVEHLLHDYPFPALPRLQHLYGIVGRPMRGSRSPRLHNSAYRTLGLSALFLPMPADEFSHTWRVLCAGFDELGLTFGGATVVAPFKEDALRLADTASAEADHAGAANILVRDEGGWRAHTTDPIGVVGALRRAGVSIAGRKAVVVGCGGAGRGAVVGLSRAGAHVTITNRGARRGRYAAELLGVDYVPLSWFAPERYSLIVHATPVRDELPFAVDRMADDAVVVDLSYGPRDTRLVAAERGRRVVIDGSAVLAVEVDRQFRLMTGRSRPTWTESLDGHDPSAVPLAKESVR